MASVGLVGVMVGLTSSSTSRTTAQRIRIMTGLVALVVAVGLALLGAWPSAIGLALGTVVGAGVIGYRFSPSDLPSERSRHARRYLARTRRAVWRIVVVGLVLIIVGFWVWPIEILGVFWLAQWATAIPVAGSAAKAAN
jgi:hypothetical protein